MNSSLALTISGQALTMQTLAGQRRESHRRADLARALVDTAGLFGLLAAAYFYQPLEHDYFYIAGIVLFFLPFGIQIYVRRRAKSNAAERQPQVSSLLFLGPLLVAVMVAVNGAFDTSPPEQKLVIVNRKWIVTGTSKGAGPTYEAEFPSWRKSGVEKISVDRSTFKTIQAGELIAMEVHRGLLGFTWVTAVRAPGRVRSPIAP